MCFKGTRSTFTLAGVGALKSLSELNKKDRKVINHATIKVISDLGTLVLAYELSKSKPGFMTPGVTPETLDGMTMAKLGKLSEQLQAGKFKFSPSRRVWIPKPGKVEKRPLGI